MYRKLCICCLFGIFMVLSYWKYISHYNRQRQMPLKLGRLNNYTQALNHSSILDTYFQRIAQFLNERNASFLSYERMITTDDNLLREIKKKVAHLREVEQQQALLNIKNGEEIRNGCQQSCCWSQRRISNFYNGEKTRLPTILDRLSPIDYKLLADVHYGKLPVPDGIKLSKLNNDILPCLQNNTVIYVDMPDLEHFFENFHNKISVNYILITGDSDLPCPLHIIPSHSRLLDQIFSEKTRIIHWFSTNCDLGNNEQWKKSKVFSCIPQGINEWSDQRYYMQLASGKDDSIHNTYLKANDYWILTSFKKQNRPEYRKPLWDLSCNGRLKNISKCFYRSISLDQWKYYIHVARSKFVFSPPGAGMDCYRTWEALYLGSIPIIINSAIDSIFQELPVLIVNNYEEINLELLKNIYENMTKQTYDYRRLYKGYWQSQINYYKKSSETIQIHYKLN